MGKQWFKNSDRRVKFSREYFDKKFSELKGRKVCCDSWLNVDGVIDEVREFSSPLFDELSDQEIRDVIINNRKASSVAESKRKREIKAGTIDLFDQKFVYDRQTINCDELNIGKYQRQTLNESLIRSIEKDFDKHLFLPLLVGKRDDNSLWIIDGQHRYHGAITVGMDKIACDVIPSTGHQFEADLFIKLQDKRTNIGACDKFAAAVEAEIPIALSLLAVVNEHGFRIPRSKGLGTGWPNINCVGSLQSHYKKYGAKILHRTLFVIEEAYPPRSDDRRTALSDYCLIPIFILIGSRPEINDKRLIQILCKNRFDEFRSKGKYLSKMSGYSRGKAIAAHILLKYNERISKKLPNLIADSD